MSRTTTRARSSLFHRRLLLLFGAMVLAFGVLSLQLLRLAVAQGQERRQVAEAKLDRRTYLPTYRGRIFDRNGRLLAVDRPSYDIAIQYEVINGSWELEQATRRARRESTAARWKELTPEEQTAAIEHWLPTYEAVTDEIWAAVRRHGALSAEELAARRDAIRAEVHSLAAAVWDRQRMVWERKQEERQRMTFVAPGEQERVFKPQQIAEQRQAHVILSRVTDDVAFYFTRLEKRLEEEKWRGLIEVQDSSRREYPAPATSVLVDRSTLPGPLRTDQALEIPVTGVADHLLGALREELYPRDIEHRPFLHRVTGEVDLGGYRYGDNVGARGLEEAYEPLLRGERGLIIEHQDTGEIERVEPVPGRDLHLSLDIDLQCRIQAILSPQLGLTVVQPWHHNDLLEVGRPLNSAAVVLEVSTGEILAAVARPTIAEGRVMDALHQAIDRPYVNRATEAIYPPGSIIKPLVLVAAVEAGVHDLDQTIVCNGHYFPQNQSLARCWIYREKYNFQTHGELGATEALARSCNIYFYTLGDHLGIDLLCDWLGRFGMGQRLQCGSAYTYLDPGEVEHFGGEAAGSLPDQSDRERYRKEGRDRAIAVSMAIGQGPLTWTPLHAANAYATLARDGVMRDANLILDPAPNRVRRGPNLDLPAALVNTALEGLRQSVEEPHGTGHHITFDEQGVREPILNAPGVTVWAKTGTAEAPPLPRDTNGNGVLDEEDEPLAALDHAWFVGLVGPRSAARPLYAIAVLVEYGGSGGRVAGPIANQIIRALQDENYLPGGGR